MTRIALVAAAALLPLAGCACPSPCRGPCGPAVAVAPAPSPVAAAGGDASATPPARERADGPSQVLTVVENLRAHEIALATSQLEQDLIVARRQASRADRVAARETAVEAFRQRVEAAQETYQIAIVVARSALGAAPPAPVATQAPPAPPPADGDGGCSR